MVYSCQEELGGERWIRIPGSSNRMSRYWSLNSCSSAWDGLHDTSL